MFSLHTFWSLSQIVGIEFHIYADDHQLYLLFQPINQDGGQYNPNMYGWTKTVDGTVYVETQ